MNAPDQPLRNWDDLDHQTALRVEYGHWLDNLPPTRFLETEVARFRAWPRERGSQYRGSPVTVP